MNTITRFASTTSLFSTDATALGLKRFMAARPAPISRPEVSTQARQPAGASIPLDVLYPSLYAEGPTVVQRCSDYLRAIAIVVGSPFAARKPVS